MKRPNVLIFMIDHGQGAVFDPGHPAITPNASRLAAEGVQFREAYCPTAHCCPSRATFMTGLAPSMHGVLNNVSNSSAINRGLVAGVRTFGEDLRGAGYNLTYCGKWHVSDIEGPSDRGWEERLVTSNRGASLARLQEQWWRSAEQDDLGTGRRRPGAVLRPGWGDYTLYATTDAPVPAAGGSHGDEAVVDAAVGALREMAAKRSPWCLFVGPIGPHDPYVVPRRWVDRYSLDEVVLPQSYRDAMSDKPGIYRRMREQIWGQLSEEETRDAVRHYWAYCSYEDDLLGRVLAELEASGRADDTVVVLVSDHGDYVGAHGLFLKGVPAFREAYHVPALVRWPAGIVNPGRVVDELVSLADFAPTFIELAGVGSAGREHLSGRSLTGFFADESPSVWRKALLTQMNGVELYYSQRSVITAEWKFVYNGFDFDELYSRRDDPWETRNLAADERYGPVADELMERLWELAEVEEDWRVFNRYATVALARRGPLGKEMELRGQRL